MSELHAAKAEWRARLRARLAAMSPSDRATQSRTICDRVLALDGFRTAAVILLYRPMATEVDVTPLWQDAVATGRRAYLPELVGPDRPLRFVHVGARADDWCRTMKPLPVERSAASHSLTADDAAKAVIIVPGLGFSCQGCRIGRGGGHYDRSLMEPPISRQGYRIGVAFSQQLTEGLPVDSFDAPMHAVATPDNVWVAGLPLATTP